MKIYNLNKIQKMYSNDRKLFEAKQVLAEAGYKLINEEIDVAGSGLKQVEENPRVVSFLEKVLDNLEHFGHLIEEKIDNYLLGRLLDIAKAFDVDKVINYLKSNNCYI